MSTSVATFTGTLRAVANEKHPLQTTVEFVLTDFKPNKNNQAIPLAEAESLMRTALHMPLKINLKSGKASGHKDAWPIGPITQVTLDDSTDEPKLIASATVWRDEFPDVDQFLKTAKDPIGTSWELYYSSARAESGIDWLEGVVFAGTAIVDNPAYGNRTQIFGIAENMEELQAQFDALQNQLISMVQVLSETYYEFVQAERTNEIIFNAETLGDRFTEILTSMRERINQARGLAENVATLKAELATLETSLSEAKAELDVFKTEKANAEKAAKELERKQQLLDRGIAESDIDIPFITGLTDDAFTTFVGILSKASKTSAEFKAPDFVGKNDYSIAELADALKS